MNIESPSEVAENQKETDSIEVRQQSFTFSKVNQHDNPQSSPQKVINSMEKERKIEPATTEKEDHQDSRNEGRLNRSSQHRNHGQKTPPQKQSTSLTPVPRGTTSKGHEQESDSEDFEAKDYNGLTMKLETALKKISHSKEMNKTLGQPDSVWRRFQECEERKKKDLQLKKQQSQKLKSRHYKDKPTINKHSARLARQVGYEPIYSRFEKLMEVKRKKEEELEESRKRKEAIEEEMFKEQLNRHMRKPEHMRTYDNYYEEMVAWKEKKDKVNREKLEQQKLKEMEGATFKPTLNNKSKKMVSSHNRLPIEQRGLLKKKSTEQYSFAPNLAKKSTR